VAEAVVRAAVVEWKFTQLDSDGDGLVDGKELDRLGRLVGKLVKPASCAASFQRRCDTDDRDSRLTRREWTACFDDDDDDDDDDDVETSRSAADGSRSTLGRIAGGQWSTRSTQPCIPPGSLNRVPASAWVRAGMSPLPGGR